jgi:hypothetical protein
MSLRYNRATESVTGTIRDLNGGKPRTINPLEVSSLREQYADKPAQLEVEIVKLQTALDVMCGGGMLGRFAQCQPGEFYIDQRCGKLPGTRKQIENAVAVLCAYAVAAGYDIHGFQPDGKHLYSASIPYAGWILEG